MANLVKPKTVFSIFCLSGELSAAVVVHSFEKPLAPNTLGFSGNTGPGYLVDGVLHQFWWLPTPAEIDLDGDSATDITFIGSGRTGPTQAMFASLSGGNMVWSRAGGAQGLDQGSIATALIGGTILGPSLSSIDPQVGWHNDQSTLAPSLILAATSGSPVEGEFFPLYPFELKYLGVRFSINGESHYGWMAITSYFWFGEEMFIQHWAYESEPNKAIIVGVIPESSTIVLIIFATFLTVFRRRIKVEPRSLMNGAGANSY